MNKCSKGAVVFCIVLLFIGVNALPIINADIRQAEMKNHSNFDDKKNIFNSDSEWGELMKLYAPNSLMNDRFGRSVVLDGDYALIGASDEDDRGASSGAAYVYHREGSNWVEQDKLIASDVREGDGFGWSVDLDGDYALIGAIGDDDLGVSSGAAYVYHREGSNWVEQRKLTASDGREGDYFAYSVSLDGDYALIGANRNDQNGEDSGAAYVFYRWETTWVEQEKLITSDGIADDSFGVSVSLDGDYALIGSQWNDEKGENSGAAYVFHREGSNWIEQEKLSASDTTDFDLFGFSVFLEGNYSIIGAIRDDDNGPDSGSAYIFYNEGASWNEKAKLTGSDVIAGNLFGYSVDLDGDFALIGMLWDDEFPSSAYVFHREGTEWFEDEKLTPSDATDDDHFGCSVSLDGDYVLIGAECAHGEKLWSGAAYIFRRNIEGNQPPDTPTITGLSSGRIREENYYHVSTTDINGDDIKYVVDWGDDSTAETHYSDSGETIQIKHTYTKKGDYVIRVKAVDCYTAESDWGTLEVTMPLSLKYSCFSLLQNIFGWLSERYGCM